MLLIPQILVRTFALGASAGLIACGQQGPLYLPPAGAVQRATPPESLLPPTGTTETTLQPALPASAPQHQ
ncbi:lipoprotein [Rhodoferax sp.]|uniref:LPS translocon maturation chaperone LptM n=1 Tax=Rhodoferax sp. TaxID=50421 RepID=UPI0026379187|nr:lipoprotein [Rhodoferax sp.]MDD2919225.1 lipoprotein [Rhodoferax sp.]